MHIGPFYVYFYTFLGNVFLSFRLNWGVTEKNVRVTTLKLRNLYVAEARENMHVQ